jgi:signal transduction histidine kinase
VVVGWLRGQRPDGVRPSAGILAYFGVVAVVLGFLVVQGMVGVVGLERRVARWALGPDEREVMRRRIAQLSTSRADVVAAVDAERRRIERDLHDGVQQQLVALGMLLGRARRAADSTELLRDAQGLVGRALGELRDVAWRVYPAVLDEEGLGAALEGVAARSAVPVEVEYGVGEELVGAVRTAVYFVVCEAVTNAAKHAGASRITVRVGRDGERAVVRVVDDGCGGADPAGAGLSGLARRVAALDGTFAVRSPAGGPTEVVAEVPCG